MFFYYSDKALRQFSKLDKVIQTALRIGKHSELGLSNDR